MSKKYPVTWAVVAQNDLKQIIEYISIDSPGNTSQILKKIKQKASDLYTMPDRGRIVPDLKDQGIHTYRELIIPPWRIIYRISDTTVFGGKHTPGGGKSGTPASIRSMMGGMIGNIRAASAWLLKFNMSHTT